jgi:uncharacterized protein YpmS
MARRKNNRRDWRVTVFVVISLIIVLSMILAMIVPGLSVPG